MSIWPFEVGDEVGELVAGAGAQVDRAFEGLFEQRGFRLGVAEHRAGGQFAGQSILRRTGPWCRGS